MLKTILKLTIPSLLAGAVLMLPVEVQAQEKAKPEAKETKKKANPHPFHGTLGGVDKTAKTITVGKMTYQITSETKITKDGKPAMLEDGVVGENVTGYIKPTDDGKLVASAVHFGAKDAKASEKKSEKKSTK